MTLLAAQIIPAGVIVTDAILNAPLEACRVRINAVTSDQIVNAAVTNAKKQEPNSYVCLSFFVAGALAGTYEKRFKVPAIATIVAVYARTDTNVAGESVDVDVEKNDTSILSAAITIAADTTWQTGTVSTSAVALGDEISIFVDNIANTPENLSVDVWIKIAHL